MNYLKLPLDNPTTVQDAFTTWQGFVQLCPEETPIGPNRIYELDDHSDGAWSYDFHWRRPAEKVDAIGCSFVRDVELWGSSIAVHAGRLIGYGVEADLDNWRPLTPLREDGFFDIPAPIDRVLDRPVLIADGHNVSTWGHWLVEYLPRFAIARDLLGMRFDELLVPLPFHIPDWAIDLLESTCSVRRSNIVRYRAYAERLICPHAVVPSYSYSGIYTFHSFLRRFYHRLRPQLIGPRTRVCVSRAGVIPTGGNRRFPLRKRFEDMAKDRGYQIVRPETLTLSDQINLFANATVVIGEHGSAMHNAVFCDPGTVVGCIGFWNPIQLHLGYVCQHRNVYLTRGCIWPSEGQPDFQLAVTEDDLASFLDKIDELSVDAPTQAPAHVPVKLAEGPQEENVGGSRVGETTCNPSLSVPLSVGLEILTHVQNHGDVMGAAGSWAGNEAVTHWIEGFIISPNGGVEPADLLYRAVLFDGSISPWVPAGVFCGSRGQSRPLLGFQLQLRGAAAVRYDCLCGALFADCTRLDPSTADVMCVAPSRVPMAAIWIELRPKEDGAAPSQHSGKTTT